MADRTDLDTSPIIPHRVFHPAFNRMLITVFFHIDEINDNQTRQIAQAQLARQFISGFQIGFKRGFFDIAFAC